LELAFSYLENTGTNVFLTGKAGTGKTTFLKQLKSRSPKRMVVLAPTGVAAINAGGVTIHSFFQLSFGPYIAGVTRSDAASYVNKFSREKISIIRSIDLLVIDEISMVRADVLDAMDDVLRRYRDRHRPFGGVQLLMIGDIQQLAPVAKEEEWALLKKYYESVYFFHSKALQETSYVSIELKTIYRQQDTLFIDLLNRVRENHADDETLRLLNQRYIPAFTPADEEEYITLTTHNQQARKINDSRLASLTTPAHTFHAEVKDDFPDYAFPTDRQLVLKEGAQVMFVKNDSSPDKRYYNGKIGKVVAIGRDTIEVRGKEDGETIRVTREEWKNTRYTIDAGSKELIEKVEGTFKQYPLKTAWAITIHKSQGLTFDKAVIDPHAAFAHGQVYVALSRCRSLEGLVLSAPLHATALKKEETIDHFVSGITDPAQEELQRACKEYYKTLLLEQFNYDLLFLRVDYVYRVTSEHLYLLYPGFVQRYREARDHLLLELGTVSKRFQNQLARLIDASNDPATDPALAERVAKGQLYFEEQTERFAVSLLEEGMPDIDNKETRKIIERAIAPLIEECNVKTETLKALQGGFSIKKYLIAKAKARIPVPIPKPSGEKKSAAGRKEKKGEDTLDIQHPALYQALRAWRRAESEKTNLPAYSILQQRALVGIANLLPTSKSDLLAIPGIGKVIAERYGRQILELVDTHRMRSDHEE
jgi:GTPase SAR1 family protein